MIVLVLCIVVFLVLLFILLIRNNIEYKETKLDEKDSLLMLRYNYSVKLNMLKSMVREFEKSNQFDHLIMYSKQYIEKINDDLYNEKQRKTSIEFENELLYRENIINLEIVFYAFHHLFSQLKKERVNIENQNRFYKKNISLFKKIEWKVLNISDKQIYYKKVELMKDEYRDFINELDIKRTIQFINYALKTLS